MAAAGNRDLFKGTAQYYARYRPGYPEPFFAHVVDRFRLDGTGRLLDLGCGTGQLAVPLASRFQEVVGMDPEPEMLAVATAQARAAGVGHVTWIEGGSDDLPALQPQLGTFRLVTMGSSFHWMDQQATLLALAGLVAPFGGLVIAGSASLWNRANPWQEAVKSVIQRWLGAARRAGSSTYAEPAEPFEAVIARSPFRFVERYRHEYLLIWDIERIIGHLFSTSFCSVRVLGSKREPFESDLRQTLREIEPSGHFHEDVALEAFLAWEERPAGLYSRG
jgi:ubiquinone/menaquinone biosynthesis C-methylase UbiE